MIYEAEVRRSLRNGKYMFFLRRDGHTIRVSDACYLSQESAVSAARRAAYAAHGRVMLPKLTAAVFRVRREHAARTGGHRGLCGHGGRCAEDGVLS